MEEISLFVKLIRHQKKINDNELLFIEFTSDNIISVFRHFDREWLFDISMFDSQKINNIEKYYLHLKEKARAENDLNDEWLMGLLKNKIEKIDKENKESE